MQAEFIKDVNPENNGDQKLWKVGDHYVVTSALDAAFDTMRPETYVFRSDSEGVITEWGELAGSFQGDMDHERAIDGYVGSLADA